MIHVRHVLSALFSEADEAISKIGDDGEARFMG